MKKTLLPDDIGLIILLTRLLTGFGAVFLIVMIFTVLTGYNKLYGTVIIILLSLTSYVLSYYFLSLKLAQKSVGSYLFLVTSGIINLAISFIGLLFVFFVSINTPLWIQGSVGFVIYLAITGIPSISAGLAFSKRDYFAKKKSGSDEIGSIIVALILGTVNSLMLNLFSYLLLVLLFPNAFGINS